MGTAHKYSADLQARELVRLNLAQPDKWEVVASGPPRTGLAMVAYGGKLYRIGGWEAKNAAGDKWDLYSSRDFSSFDPKTGEWRDLAPLPQGRSSHDAAMLGSQLYVIGGWELKGEGDGEWHETAYVCDLADANPQWQVIAKPPFNRRALAVAGFAGKVYVIGGMDDSNETTTGADIYDPQSRTWTKGPALPGKGFDGFGASAFGTASGLFATTGTGGLYRLSADGQSWAEVGKLNHPRIFHRLLAAGDGELLVVGGTSRGGKVREVESLQLKLAVGQ
jgi:N-acetylneuraminic acid mutarotase